MDVARDAVIDDGRAGKGAHGVCPSMGYVHSFGLHPIPTYLGYFLFVPLLFDFLSPFFLSSPLDSNFRSFFFLYSNKPQTRSRIFAFTIIGNEQKVTPPFQLGRRPLP
jgi:hypothetical protein